jgi:serine/threonine-protein kinase
LFLWFDIGLAIVNRYESRPMIARDADHVRAADRMSSGVLLALLELTAEGSDGPARSGGAAGASRSAEVHDPLRSSALLESLHREWTESEQESPDDSAVAAGRRLGRYWLVEPLGQGSQAQVWKAIRSEPALGMVALKVLTPDRARDPVRRARLTREAELGARLANPGLLPTYEFGEVEGMLFLAMPLVQGGTLGDAIAVRRRCGAAPRPDAGGWAGLTVEQYARAVLGITIRVARALAQAHAGRVAHRDVKPANILLERDRLDRAFLADFGLGLDLDLDRDRHRRWDDGASPGEADLAGTPLYMAPERLQGREADPIGSDVYALGVTLFEALTLVHPFPVPRAIPRSCLAAYLLGLVPPRPREVMPAIARPLEAIILRAMDPNPARRYGSAADLADDLEWFRTLSDALAGPLASPSPSPSSSPSPEPHALVLDGSARRMYKTSHHSSWTGKPRIAESAPIDPPLSWR